jgi:hemoglobin/transferrin/lactoferrin receptor protein
LKLNLSSGFRAPNLDDVAKIFDSEPGKVVVPNENLKPEYLYNIDAGVIWGSREKVMVQFTAFYSYLVNAIVRRDYQLNGMDSIWYDGELSQVQAMVNTGSATIYGFSAGLDWRILDYLRFNSMLTYIDGEDDEGYALRHAPPLYGSTTLSFEQNSFRVAMSAVYNAEVAHDNMAPTESDKTYLYATDENGNSFSPAWWTLNLKASYAFNQEKFIVTLGVENILDYRYIAYSSGIASPGRNFIAALLYRF